MKEKYGNINDKETNNSMSSIWIFGFIGAILLTILSLTLFFSAPVDNVYAAIHVGDTTLEGYEPSDIVSTDMSVNMPEDVTGSFENLVVRILKALMPYLMIACAIIIAYNGIKNIFLPKEKRVAMGGLIKNMLVQFFFILFSFIIVEVIVFAISGGQTILLSTILNG